MNRVFDYNGVQISPSKPVQKLVKRSRILHIDSSDRDIVQYPNNGDFIVYLPRAYEKVFSINIKSAEFPLTNAAGPTIRRWTGPSQTGVASTITTQPKYFFMEIQGLNMSDETAPVANRSASTNSVFGKFVVPNITELVLYNESSNAHQEIEFYPPVAKVDRLHFRIRTHEMTSNEYMYWPSDNWSISLDVETLENSFDDFSSIETRVGER